MNALGLVSRGYLFSGGSTGTGGGLVANMAPVVTGRSDVPHVAPGAAPIPRTVVNTAPDLKPITRRKRKK